MESNFIAWTYLYVMTAANWMLGCGIPDIGFSKTGPIAHALIFLISGRTRKALRTRSSSIGRIYCIHAQYSKNICSLNGKWIFIQTETERRIGAKPKSHNRSNAGPVMYVFM